MSSEQQVTELGKGKEDNHEHDHKADQIFLGFTERARQLGHRLVEADVLEHLKVCKHKTGLSELLPKSVKMKVGDITVTRVTLIHARNTTKAMK